MFVFDFPNVWARRLTIPPSNEEDYDLYLVMAWPFLGVPVLGFFLIKQLWSLWWLLYLPFAIIWAVLFWRFAPERRKPPKIFWVLIIIVLVAGLLWSYYLCGVLIDLLSMIGVITKLEKVFLGLTVLGIGNALPDTLVAMSVAKKG